MRHLLLISTSRIYGQPYMAYCADLVKAFWGEQKELLFVPYAAQDYAEYAQHVRQHLEPLGFTVRSLHDQANLEKAIQTAKGIFVGGGNTFLLAKTLQEKGLLPLIRERVMLGEMRYMGSSAGSNMACPTMKTTNDMPIVQPPSFEALGLVPFQINPHYLDPDPSSQHMGETRAQRIQEFHEWNDTPVLGIREGGLVEVHGDQAILKGLSGARLFRPQEDPEEFEPGDDLSFLLRE